MGPPGSMELHFVAGTRCLMAMERRHHRAAGVVAGGTWLGCKDRHGFGEARHAAKRGAAQNPVGGAVSWLRWSATQNLQVETCMDAKARLHLKTVDQL